PPRRLRPVALGDGGCDQRRGARGALPPLDVRACRLRPARAAGERRAPGPQWPRARRARPDHRPLLRDGPLPGALPDPHAAVGRPHPGARPDRGRATRRGGASMTPIDTGAFAAHWEVALPGLLVALTAMVVMVADLIVTGPERDALAAVALLVLAAAAGAALWLWAHGAGPGGFGDTLRADRYALFFALLLVAATALSILLSVDFLRQQALPAGEYYALMLLSTSGMIFMAAANDLIVIFLALEIMSVAVYVLFGMLRRELRSNEASLKYFLLGAFATGFLLYGIAFFYGATGSTRLDVLAQVAARDGLTPFMVLGIALVLVGFGFKVALIPFHV